MGISDGVLFSSDDEQLDDPYTKDDEEVSDDQQQTPAAPLKLGPLLDLDEEDAAKYAYEKMPDAWKKQDKNMRNRKEMWRVNKMRRKGAAFVRLQRDDPNRDTFRAYVPPGAVNAPPSLNKAARLCDRLVSTLFADPPTPECVPDTDDDTSRETAELATRALQQESSSKGYNGDECARLAESVACTYSSGFVRLYVDPMGGGHRPKRLMCCPGVAHMADAVKGDPTLDPQTGQRWIGDFVTRYLKRDGSLVAPETYDAQDADDYELEWLPKIKREIIDGRRLRFLPAACPGIADADGVLIGTFVKLGDLRNMPTVGARIAQMSDTDLSALKNFRPSSPKDLLPDSRAADSFGGSNSGSYTDGGPGTSPPDSGNVDDDAWIFVLIAYMKQSGTYPYGAYCMFGGNQFALLRQRWVNPNTMAPLGVPVSQFKQYDAGDVDDPYGTSEMDKLGAANELRAEQIGSIVEWQHRFNRPKRFVPYTSMLKTSDLNNPTAMVVPISPGGEPVLENIPPYPKIGTDFLSFLTQDMDDESGLQAPAQGQTTPEVSSGYHAAQLIEQTAVGLSSIKQNAELGLTRMWRISLELMQAFYTIEQQVSWEGDDKTTYQEEFSGADLEGVHDVRIMRGSFTMLTAANKAATAEHMAQTQVISAYELRRMILGNVGGQMGLQDDPVWSRIRRQLGQFQKGPPVGWMPAYAGPPQPGQPPPPLDPECAKIFDDRLVDHFPECAKVRAEEMARFQATSQYSALDPNWRQCFDIVFDAARKDANMMTAGEQAQQHPQAQPKVAESLNYRDAPPDVQRQIEAQAGLQPSQMPVAPPAYGPQGGQPAAGAGQVAQPTPPGMPANIQPSTLHHVQAPTAAIPGGG